jgi:16S rRNA (cytidine1402-2'-O)-methyltransferase
LSDDDDAAAPRPAGRLVLVGTPIGNLRDLAPRAVDTLRAADWIYAEDTRRTRALLAHAGIEAGRRLRALHAHTEARVAEQVAAMVREGATVAYVSDAGMPTISDPGERLVQVCAEAGVAVSVVPGPSAVDAALAVSGLPVVPFTFVGFVPRRGRDRRDALAAIATATTTTVVYEAPHRLAVTLDDLRDVAGPTRAAAVVRELTKVHESVTRGPLDALAAAVNDGVIPARGECVIVIGPAPRAIAAPDDGAVASRADQLLAAGTSARDAARALIEEFAMPRSAAYDAVLARKARDTGEGRAR